MAIRARQISVHEAIQASTIRHQDFSYLLAEKLPFPNHTLVATHEVDGDEGKKKTLGLQGVIKADESDIILRHFAPEIYKKVLTAIMGGHSPHKLFAFNDARASEVNSAETNPEEVLRTLKFHMIDFSENGAHFTPVGKKILLNDGLGNNRVRTWIDIDNTIKDIAVDLMKENLSIS